MHVLADTVTYGRGMARANTQSVWRGIQRIKIGEGRAQCERNRENSIMFFVLVFILP